MNAQKKRLDAWLIYRCSHCDRTWNLPVFERLRVSEIDSALLDRLHGNCPVLAAEWGSDVAALGRYARAVEPVEPQVSKEMIQGARDAPLMQIIIECGVPRMHLDRLLAAELGRSRSRIARWEEEGVVVVTPAHRFVQDGQMVYVRMSSLSAAERPTVVRAATGLEP
ncbi:MAG TPA: DUF1062 domain-containing protein [Kiloniellales bacterium]|nr:DUF1062 domain-containing protein [Kiloniellales bacterium]